MRFVKKILSVMLVMGALAAATSAQAADDASKPVMAKKEAAKDLVLRGDAKCTSCHDEADSPELLAIGKTRHGTNADKRTPECTSCHGESEKHTSHKGSDKPPKPDRTFGKSSTTSAADRNNTCLTCHQGGNRITWQSSTHSTRDVVCSNCHTVHNRDDKARAKATQTEVCYTCHKEQRAQMNRVSHHPVPEGKMGCSSCHNVHGSNPKQLVKGSTNETCYSCHMEKRGPFVHNHQPVSEDCAICHQPHGTNTPNLLVQRPPMLCTGCHGPSSHPSQPPALLMAAPNGVGSSLTYNTNARAGWGTEARGCLNCHTNIHGGNSTQNNATTQRFRR